MACARVGAAATATPGEDGSTTAEGPTTLEGVSSRAAVLMAAAQAVKPPASLMNDAQKVAALGQLQLAVLLATSPNLKASIEQVGIA